MRKKKSTENNHQSTSREKPKKTNPPCPDDDPLLKTESRELPANFEETEEFKACFKELETTAKNLYITGNAGTGKTTFLKYFLRNTKKEVAVLAPTGIAAINSGGQTIHSFFKFRPQLIRKRHIRKLRDAEEFFSNLDMLIIDEASMVRADMMDGVDIALRRNRGVPVPFGGIQLVIIGDLFQLPPVLGKDVATVFRRLFKTPYFLSANIFEEKGVSFYGYSLKKIHRQQDTQFKELLNKVRNNSLDEADLALLNTKVAPELCNSIKDCITLTPRNDTANSINKDRLDKLDSKEFIYKAKIEGQFDRESYPNEISLRLKVGVQVLMIRNDPAGRWVNGSIGTIGRLEDEAIWVRINGQLHNVKKEEWKQIQYGYNETLKKITQDETGRFTQYPIKLAWAITIHKSQGLTFDKVIVDLDGIFTHGQTYVALSRCRSLEGLILKRPMTRWDIVFDERVVQLSEKYIIWEG